MSFPLMLDNTLTELRILRRQPVLTIQVGQHVYAIRGQDDDRGGDGTAQLEINGEIIRFSRAADGADMLLRMDGISHRISAPDPDDRGPDPADLAQIRAPMPGTVVTLHVSAAETVTQGQPLITIESMKLQTVLRAPAAGRIAALSLVEGDLFTKDQVLMRLDPAEVA